MSGGDGGLRCGVQAGFFDLDERLKALSAKGDALERLAGVVEFEMFCPDLARAVPRLDGARGGRPPFDLVLMFKVLVIQASHSLSDERTEFLIKDRLSFMRFLGLGLAEKPIDIAVPAFGYKSHLGIDRRHGLIRTWLATDASRHEGAQLPALISKANSASDVWADTACRSKASEQHFADNGLRSQVHRRKPQGRPMPVHIARGNGRRSKVRGAVEHVFAQQEGPMALVARTIGLARATVKIGLADAASFRSPPPQHASRGLADSHEGSGELSGGQRLAHDALPGSPKARAARGQG